MYLVKRMVIAVVLRAIGYIILNVVVIFLIMTFAPY